MTVVNPDSIAGITSVTSSGTTLQFYDVNGNLLDVSANLSGELTVGTGATISSPGASIIDFETNGTERLRIGSSGQIGIAGANFGSSGQVLTSGGSGSAVSWSTIPTQISFSNDANNRVITGTGSGLNGEVNLTYDGSDLVLNHASGDKALRWATGGTNKWSIYHNNGAGALVAFDNTNNAERVRIDSAGNMGLGVVPIAPGHTTLHIGNSTSSQPVRLHMTTNGTGATASDGFSLSIDGSSSAVNLIQRESADMQFYTAGTERLRITGIGSVGIGTAIPQHALDVRDTGLARIRIRNDATASGSYASLNLHTAKGNWSLYSEGTSAANNYLKIWNNIDGSVFYIKQGGNVGIDNDNPAEKLDVGGNVRVDAGSSGQIDFGDCNSGSVAFGRLYADSSGTFIGSKSNHDLILRTNNAERLRINTAGQVKIGDGSYNDNSSRLVVLDSNTEVLADSEPIYNNSSKSFITVYNNHSSGNGQETGINFVPAGNSNGAIALYAKKTASFAGDLIMRFRTSSTNSDERFRFTNSGGLQLNRQGHYLVTNSGKALFGVDIVGSPGNTNEYGGAISFGHNQTGRSAIASVQGPGNDPDVSGLSFFTHPSSTGSDNAVEQMRLHSDGNLLVGDELTVTPHSGMFQVIHTGGGQLTNDCLTFLETNSEDWCMKTNYNKSSSSHFHIDFMEEGTRRGTIMGTDGSNVAFTPGSDYRMKENVVDLTATEGINYCKNLKPRKYNWIDNRKHTGKINTVNGFIAHEVEEAGIGHLVYGNGKDAVNEDGSIDPQTLDYAGITPVLAAAIKGLIDKVETLEVEVASLKSEAVNDRDYESKIDKLIDYFKL